MSRVNFSGPATKNASSKARRLGWPEDMAVETDVGFCTLDDAQRHLEAGRQLRFAVLDVKTQQRVFVPGRVFVRNEGEARVWPFISIAQPEVVRRWSASEAAGNKDEAEDEKKADDAPVEPPSAMASAPASAPASASSAASASASSSSSKRSLSPQPTPERAQPKSKPRAPHLRTNNVYVEVLLDQPLYVVTATQVKNHQKVNWPMRGVRGQEVPVEPWFERAETVMGDAQCACDDADCEHRRKRLRMVANAPKGVAYDQGEFLANELRPLGLSTPQQIASFLELLGFWLGDGSLDVRAKTITFKQKKSADWDFLRSKIREVGLSPAEWSEGAVNERGLKQITIKNGAWFQYFARFWGMRYQHHPTHGQPLLVPMRMESAAVPTHRPCAVVMGRQQVLRPQTGNRWTAPDSPGDLLCRIGQCRRRFFAGRYNTRKGLVDARSGHERECDGEPWKDPRGAGVVVPTIDEAPELPRVELLPAAGDGADDEYDVAAEYEEESEYVKSVKWAVWWMLRRIGLEQLRLIVEGLRRADGSFATDEHAIYTSGMHFRDQLLRLLLNAGYSAFFKLHFEAGALIGYAMPDGSLAREPVQGAKPVKTKEPAWTLSYGDVKACLPNFTIVRDVHIVQRKTRVWGVVVQHPDHLIFVMRVQHRADGRVYRASRPVIIGDCSDDIVIDN